MSGVDLQDTFFEQAKTTNAVVLIHLIGKVKLIGTIKDYDKYSITINANGQDQLIYKQAISTIVLPRRRGGGGPHRPGGFAPRPGGPPRQYSEGGPPRRYADGGRIEGRRPEGGRFEDRRFDDGRTEGDRRRFDDGRTEDDRHSGPPFRRGPGNR